LEKVGHGRWKGRTAGMELKVLAKLFRIASSS
jgi:hypothetical protein